MFKQFRDRRKAPKIMKAITAGNAAITADRIDIAQQWIDRAYKMSLNTTLPRRAHINMITCWGLMSVSLRDKGHMDLADQCTRMSNLLQARFEAGDYYRESS